LKESIYNQIYDELYSGRAIIADVDVLVSSLSLNKDDSILDFGCGTGLYAKVLETKFNKIIGVDVDPTLKEAFEANTKKSEFSINLYEIEESVSGIFSFFNVFNYIIDELELEQTVEKFQELLPSGGVVVLDVLCSNKVKPGEGETSRNINVNSEDYVYTQKMIIDGGGEMLFRESVHQKGERVAEKEHRLKLWTKEELVNTFNFLSFKLQKSLESSYINKNQIRLFFKKEGV
jgi:cyclopropane fatty-acyl-phospholipid synthase-like methyltransferase